MAVQKPQKVLLVNYAGYFLCANTFIPDNSLAGLAAVLSRHGVPVEVMDLQSPRFIGSVMDHTSREAARDVLCHLARGERPSDSLIRRYHEDRRRGEDWLEESTTAEILRKIADEQVGVVGFKLWVGEGIRHAIAAAETIRRAYPHVTLLAGGPAVQFGEHFLFDLTDAFDALVPGDGEQVVVAASCHDRLGPWVHDFNGVLPAPRHETGAGAARNDQGLPGAGRAEFAPFPRDPNLDAIPFPRYEGDSYADIGDFYNLRILDESRGCRNSCAFCCHPRFNGPGVRQRQASFVVDEMQRLQQTDGTSYFRFAGSNPPQDYVLEIAREIMRRGLHVNYSLYMSLNNAESDSFDVLRESGLRAVFLGIESGHTELLRRAHNKSNGSREHVVRVCQSAMDHGVFATLSFIVPSPFETELTKRSSLELISDIFARRTNGSVIVLPSLLMPGTRWFNQMDRYGFEFVEGMDRRSAILHGVQLSNDYLLPRDSWSAYGYRLNGKTMEELLGETEQFVRDVEQLGVLTHVDDTTYMLSCMAGTDPRTFQTRALHRLVLGGEDELSRQVREINGAACSTGG